MIRVLVTSLRGPALDWAVHQAEGSGPAFSPVKWSTKWEYAGQLIDKVGMCLHGTPDERRAFIPHTPFESIGPTALIAVCRCFVIAKLGEQVSIPQELLQ